MSSKIPTAQIELHGEYVLSGREYQSYDTNSLGKEVDYQGSRQLDNFSRRYYEKELGAGIGPSPGFSEMFGYTEPFRRFVQHETFTPQANEIPNHAASWLPGDDYYTNFHKGAPFIKIDEGYARLPGAGYEALHPEVKGLNPEDYPDIHKMSILVDVAPYSREYHTYRQKVGSQAQGNTELEIEYEKILNRVKQTRESVIKMNDQGSSSCRTQNPSRAHAGSRRKPSSYSQLHRQPVIPTALNKSTGCHLHFRVAGCQIPSQSTPETHLFMLRK